MGAKSTVDDIFFVCHYNPEGEPATAWYVVVPKFVEIEDSGLYTLLPNSEDGRSHHGYGWRKTAMITKLYARILVYPVNRKNKG
jgi:hypothetical protein